MSLTSRQMQHAFLMELKERDLSAYLKTKPDSNQIFHYINRYQVEYVNDLYEEGADRIEANKTKLGKLFVQSELSGVSINDNSNYLNGFDVTLPTNLLYPLNQRGDLTVDGVATGLEVEVKPITYDFYNVNKDNPFRKATEVKLWRLENAANHTIITDGSTLVKYYLDYIKDPGVIDLGTGNDCELHGSTHYKIVNGAVKLFLASKKDQIGYNIQKIEENNK